MSADGSGAYERLRQEHNAAIANGLAMKARGIARAMGALTAPPAPSCEVMEGLFVHGPDLCGITAVATVSCEDEGCLRFHPVCQRHAAVPTVARTAGRPAPAASADEATP